MKRLAIVVTAAVLWLAFGVGTVAAHGDKTVEEIPATFATLDSTTCQYLPAGTSITWSGFEKSVTTTRTDRQGITTVSNSTDAHGTATDQDGNRYHFRYDNTFRVSNTEADPDVFSGVMKDAFSLHGKGPARLSNGFVAVFTTDFSTLFTFDPLSSFGDSIDFATGAAHCDPL